MMAALPPLSGRRRAAPTPPPSARDSDVDSLLSRLLAEPSPASVDRRRLLLLQCQLAQLERQLLILSEAAAQRRDLILGLSSSLDDLSALLREAMASTVPGPTAPVPRRALAALLERVAGVRGGLGRAADDLLSDRLLAHHLVPNRFARAPPPTLRDLAAASTGAGMLHLARVRALEADLAALHGALVALRPRAEAWEALLPPEERLRAGRAREEAADMVARVAKDAAELGMLVPALGERKGEAAAEDVRPHLRQVRTAEARAAIEARLAALRARNRVLEVEAAALREAAARDRRRACGEAEAGRRLVAGLRAGVDAFRRRLAQRVASPVGAVAAAFDRMEERQDAASLRRFLEEVREQLPTLRECAGEVEEAAGQEQVDALLEEFRRTLARSLAAGEEEEEGKGKGDESD